jgi:hypothetical protein
MEHTVSYLLRPLRFVLRFSIPVNTTRQATPRLLNLLVLVAGKTATATSFYFSARPSNILFLTTTILRTINIISDSFIASSLVCREKVERRRLLITSVPIRFRDISCLFASCNRIEDRSGHSSPPKYPPFIFKAVRITIEPPWHLELRDI